MEHQASVCGGGVSASDLGTSVGVFVSDDAESEGLSGSGCEMGVPHSGQKTPSLNSVPHLGHFIIDSPFYFL